MLDRRKSLRVHLTAQSGLCDIIAEYEGQLENISLSGALIRLSQCIIVSLGGEYILSIYTEGDTSPIQLTVEVVCATFSLVGIKFVSSDAEINSRLAKLVHQHSSQPDKAMNELEIFRRRFIDHLHG